MRSNLSRYFCWVPAIRTALEVRANELIRAGSAPFTEINVPRVHEQVEKLYGRVARDPAGDFHFNRGASYAVALLGYDAVELATLPKISTDSFAGVANPHLIASLQAGETVLDIGSGSGTDLLLAARRVGAGGLAIGLDMTVDMIKRCQASIVESGMVNVMVGRGDAENLPLDDASVDVVLSNGALNLVPDKRRAFQEIYRVLRPGGRFLLGDIALSRGLVRFMRSNISLWTLCVAGALQEKELVEFVSQAGFIGADVTHRFDCTQGTSEAFIARGLGVHGINLYAAKP